MHTFSAFIYNSAAQPPEGEKAPAVKLSFPATKEAVQEALKAIGFDPLQYSQSDIKIRVYDITENPWAYFFPQAATIDELHYLSCRLASIPPPLQKHMQAAIIYSDPQTIQDLINLTFNVGDYALIPGVRDWGELGKQVAKNRGVQLPDDLQLFFDYEQLGYMCFGKLKGQFTPTGYCYESRSTEPYNPYNGKNLPAENKVFPKSPMQRPKPRNAAAHAYVR